MPASLQWQQSAAPADSSAAPAVLMPAPADLTAAPADSTASGQHAPGLPAASPPAATASHSSQPEPAVKHASHVSITHSSCLGLCWCPSKYRSCDSACAKKWFACSFSTSCHSYLFFSAWACNQAMFTHQHYKTLMPWLLLVSLKTCALDCFCQEVVMDSMQRSCLQKQA